MKKLIISLLFFNVCQAAELPDKEKLSFFGRDEQLGVYLNMYTQDRYILMHQNCLDSIERNNELLIKYLLNKNDEDKINK